MVAGNWNEVVLRVPSWFVALQFGTARGAWPTDPAVLAALRDCGLDETAARAVYADLLEHDDEGVRAIAVWGLGVLERSGLGGAADPAIARFDDETERVRLELIEVVRHRPLDDLVRSLLERALRDDGAVQREALRVLSAAGPEAAGFAPLIEPLLRDGPANRIDDAARAWVAIGGERSVAVEALLPHVSASIGRRSRGGSRGNSCGVLSALGDLGGESAEVREAVRPLMTSGHPTTRVWAARVFAAAGGDRARAARIAIEAWAGSTPGPPAFEREQVEVAVGPIARDGLVPRPILLELAASDDVDRRLLATKLASWTTDGVAAAEAIRPMLADPDPVVAAAATGTLDHLEDQRRLAAWRAEHGDE